MKCFSSALSFFQSAASLLKSTSSAACERCVCQKQAMTLLPHSLPPRIASALQAPLARQLMFII